MFSLVVVASPSVTTRRRFVAEPCPPVLAGVGGVEPMAYGHMSICLHLGITAEQLSALLNIVETNLGKMYSEPFRGVLNDFDKPRA